MRIPQKKRVGAAFLALIFTLIIGNLSSAMAASQGEIDALKEKQAETREQQADVKIKVANLQEQQDSVLEQKEALDEQNELARQEIELINEQIVLYSKIIEEKTKELEEAKTTEEKQKEVLRVRMRVMEETASLTYLSILFESDSVSDLLARLDFISAVMKYDKELEDLYIAAREYVELVKTEYEAVLSEHEATKAEREAKKAALEKEIAAAESLITSLESDIGEYLRVLDENEAAEAILSAQINEMVAELERQQKQAEEAMKNSGGVIPNFTTGTGSFKWPLPTGYYPSQNTYGNRFHPILHLWRFHAGTDIGAPTGTEIYACDSGTVVTAGYDGGYGNYVVLSHGNGISTRYAHMSFMAVSAGASVSKGQVIGYVGSTGLSTGAHLHFEVRINGAATDPMSYSYS